MPFNSFRTVLPRTYDLKCLCTGEKSRKNNWHLNIFILVESVLSTLLKVHLHFCVQKYIQYKQAGVKEPAKQNFCQLHALFLLLIHKHSLATAGSRISGSSGSRCRRRRVFSQPLHVAVAFHRRIITKLTSNVILFREYFIRRREIHNWFIKNSLPAFWGFCMWSAFSGSISGIWHTICALHEFSPALLLLLHLLIRMHAVIVSEKWLWNAVACSYCGTFQSHLE